MQSEATQVFTFADGQLTYQQYGHGSAVLLAFHGFGQNRLVFQEMEADLGDVFTVYAIDLFFHGQSHYVGKQLLTNDAWQCTLEKFLGAHAIDRFSVMGFSMGGRFALITAEQFTTRLDQLLLLAPDGITKTIWYRLSTSTRLGRWAFRWTLAHLSVLSRTGYVLSRVGMVHPNVLRFAELSLKTPEQRALVYESWTAFRRLGVTLPDLAQQLNESSVQVRFFMGKYDRIVPPANILPLARLLNRYELTLLDCGHGNLIRLAAMKMLPVGDLL